MSEEKLTQETPDVPAPDVATASEEGAAETAAAPAPERTAEEEAREAIEAIGKLGPLFEAAVRSIRPARLVAETQRLDRATYFRNFKGQRLDKLTRPRMAQILKKEIFERENALMAHLFMVLWNDSNRDLYLAMRKHVQTINEDVEAVEVIEDDKAKEILDDLLSREFSLEDIYICVRLNEVRFTPAFVTEHVTPPGIKAAG